MDRPLYKILVGIIAVIAFAACNKDKSAKPNGNNNGVPTDRPTTRNVYTACEGSFGSGNASLHIKDLNSQTELENAFLSANGASLGDVFQSIRRIGDRLFLCINNSDKIVVIDADTKKKVGEINIPKPRYIMPIHQNKAYVSTLYSNKVYIIDPERMIVDGTIEMPKQNPEGMAKLGNAVYVCTWDTSCNKVYIVSILDDQVKDSFTLAGYAPQQVGVDRDGAVWVLSGNATKGKQAALTRLAPLSNDIMQSYKFWGKQDPIKLTFNQAGDVLYFIGVDYNGQSGYNGIFKMGINQGSLPSTPFISTSGLQYYWALGVDPVTDEIYVGDPKGFVQKGTVSVYFADGRQKTTYNVGVGPSYFYFDE